MGTDTRKAVENPLLRSGLFLTGAETFLNAEETQKEKFEENGILTAYEASQLNLFGTDLVILSACETGLGEVNNGEGVFGLQRGFLGAGAKSVLMSLWKVDDCATKDLMIEFIKNYSTTMNKQKSLRDAQLTIMKKYPLPYFWGAFVIIGI
jgi:CHAT domain-containing protein